jgi:hypothetical protein
MHRSSRPPKAVAPTGGCLGIVAKGIDGRGNSADLFSHKVQPLHEGKAIVQMPSGPSCPGLPFSVESGSTEINTQV